MYDLTKILNIDEMLSIINRIGFVTRKHVTVYWSRDTFGTQLLYVAFTHTAHDHTDCQRPRGGD